MHVLGLWGEPGEAGENPRRHGQNTQTEGPNPARGPSPVRRQRRPPPPPLQWSIRLPSVTVRPAQPAVETLSLSTTLPRQAAQVGGGREDNTPVSLYAPVAWRPSYLTKSLILRAQSFTSFKEIGITQAATQTLRLISFVPLDSF